MKPIGVFLGEWHRDEHVGLLMGVVTDRSKVFWQRLDDGDSA